MEQEIEFAYEKEIKATYSNTQILCFFGCIIIALMVIGCFKILGIANRLDTLNTKMQGQYDSLNNSIDSTENDIIKEIEGNGKMIEKIKRTTQVLEDELIIKKQFTELCKAPVNQKHFGSTENCIDYMSR